MSIIKVPVTLITFTGERPFTLTWHTSVQADEFVAFSLKSLQEVGAVRFNFELPVSVDGIGKPLMLGVCSMDCTDHGYDCTPYQHADLESVPGMMHYMASQVLTQKELLAIEEAPFHSSGQKDVGLFVNQGGRQMWEPNCRTWRSAWGRGFLRNVALHVLCGQVECWKPREWATALAEAAPLLQGFHFRGYPGGQWARPRFRNDHNYVHKVFSMGEIARKNGYSYILSLDDDVLMPASAMAFLAKVGDESRARGCGVVAPLLQNGVPTVEMWAEEYLKPSEKAHLFQCFAGSQIRSMCPIREEVVEALLPKAWDGPSYYQAMFAYASGKQEGPVGHRLMGHPVRFNNSCGMLSLGMALERVPSEWLRWRDDHALIVGEEQVYRYLSNNAFLIHTPLYLDVLGRLELIWKNGTLNKKFPDEEQLMSKVMKWNGLRLCFASGSFGIHPAYNTQGGKSHWEQWAMRRITETLKSHQL